MLSERFLKDWPAGVEVKPESYSHRPYWPSISLVLPSFNQGQFIEETLHSIVGQNYPNLQLIVVDGGSTDETLQHIHPYEKHIYWWVSEPDRGQSHAINKGMQKATGDIINWINSDDYLLPGALLKVAESFIKHPEAHAVAAKSIKFSSIPREIEVPRAMNHDGFEEFLLGFWLMQPSTFLRADVFLPLFPLSEELHYCMDTDLFLRYFLRHGNEHVVHVPYVTHMFRLHGGSKTVKAQLRFNEERRLLDDQVMASVKKGNAAPGERATEINLDRLRNAYAAKWHEWDNDPSKKYRVVAEYAGWNGMSATKRLFACRAIVANPFRLLNWKHLLKP